MPSQRLGLQTSMLGDKVMLDVIGVVVRAKATHDPSAPSAPSNPTPKVTVLDGASAATFVDDQVQYSLADRPVLILLFVAVCAYFGKNHF